MGPLQPSSSTHRGVILTEACVSIMLVGLVLAMVSLLLIRHAQSTDYFLNYRRVQLAAESCVERMRAGVLDVANADFTDDADIAYEVRVTDADDSWRPLKRVTVSASVTCKHNRIAHYRIGTYIEPTQVQVGGGG